MTKDDQARIAVEYISPFLWQRENLEALLWIFCSISISFIKIIGAPAHTGRVYLRISPTKDFYMSNGRLAPYMYPA